MPITIDGTGSITGLSAGGLPDLSVQTADLADGAVTGAKIAAGAVAAGDLDGAQSGSAPIYGARAWVNFNGTGAIAVNASGNVLSLSDNGVGDYTVTFTTALADANFTVMANCSGTTNLASTEIVSTATSNVRIKTTRENNSTTGTFDPATVCIAVLR